MRTLDIILISLSLAMDAFTVSVCKGIVNNNVKTGITISLTFSLFQFIMPVIGYYLGSLLSSRIINYHSYFSAILLIIIGILMIKDNDNYPLNNKLNYSELFFLSIATSIDAFVTGISFSFIKTNIYINSLTIGIITLILCLIGYFLGHLFNKKNHRKYTNLSGGIILIILGIKMLF